MFISLAQALIETRWLLFCRHPCPWWLIETDIVLKPCAKTGHSSIIFSILGYSTYTEPNIEHLC